MEVFIQIKRNMKAHFRMNRRRHFVKLYFYYIILAIFAMETLLVKLPKLLKPNSLMNLHVHVLFCRAAMLLQVVCVFFCRCIKLLNYFLNSELHPLPQYDWDDRVKQKIY